MKKGMVVLIAALVFIGGCTAPRQVGGAGTDGGVPRTRPRTPSFTRFPIFPVPKELTLQREKSFIYETPNVKAGVLVLSGNVDIGSLENYFKINMAKNGWRFVNSYKYGDDDSELRQGRPGLQYQGNERDFHHPGRDMGRSRGQGRAAGAAHLERKMASDKWIKAPYRREHL